MLGAKKIREKSVNEVLSENVLRWCGILEG